MGVLPDQLFLSIRRCIFRLRARALRRKLAFTRNPPWSVCKEVVVTSNYPRKTPSVLGFFKQKISSSFA